MKPEMERDRFEVAAFPKFPVSFVGGKGALLHDPTGKEYVDFHSGYGVAILGHANEKVAAAVSRQASRLITCHGSFYNDAREDFAEKLVGTAPKGLERVLFSNSGTEAVEAAIKLSRRRTGRKKVVSMKGGFHGKTLGSLSATWNKKYRDPFGPLLDGFSFAEFGDPDSVSSLLDGDTAAVIAEPVQGEAGVVVPPPDFLRQLRELCDSREVLLVFDEIQSGLGRTGKMWASEHWGVVPDIMTVGKGLAGGVPVGAVLTTGEVSSSLKAGEHTSTFAGNPLSCAAGSATLDCIRESDLPSKAARTGDAMRERLAKVASESRLVKEVRGMGLMLAMQMKVDIRSMLLDSLERGAVTAYSGRDTFRFLPPLVIDEAQVGTGLDAVQAAVSFEERKRLG
jgi:[amino-group carrier protein]-gamma-(L-lysyl/L-ornithyl)-L-glutamate aminotransferase